MWLLEHVIIKTLSQFSALQHTMSQAYFNPKLIFVKPTVKWDQFSNAVNILTNE